MEKYIPGGSSALATVLEGARLLALPVEAEEVEADSGGGGGGGDSRALDLKSVTDRVFTDNAEAKRVMEELGVEVLTPANARHILRRRVENAE